MKFPSSIYCKLIPLVLLCFIFSNCFSEKDNDEIILTFINYKKYLLERNGEEAVKYLDAASIEYYADMLEKAKTESKEDLLEEPFLNKLMILTIRHRIPDDLTIKMNPEEFIVYAINNGMIGKESVSNLEYVKVKSWGVNTAKVLVKGKNAKVGVSFTFNKENGQWKIDITSIFKVAMFGLKQTMKMTRKSGKEFLIYLIEISSDKPYDESLWKPID